jgi:hypothetical protein
MCKVITEVTWITVPTQNVEKFSPHFEHYHGPKYLSEIKKFLPHPKHEYILFAFKSDF